MPRMTDELTLPQALRKMADDGMISTHSENCWQWHLPCAAMYAADVIDDLRAHIEESGADD